MRPIRAANFPLREDKEVEKAEEGPRVNTDRSLFLDFYGIVCKPESSTSGNCQLVFILQQRREAAAGTQKAPTSHQCKPTEATRRKRKTVQTQTA